MQIIPRAVDYFTGKALEYESYDDDDDFEDLDDDEDDDEDRFDDVRLFRLNRHLLSFTDEGLGR